MRGMVLALLLGLACAGTPVTPDAPPTDHQLRTRIERRISSDHRLCAYSIQVMVHGGTVELAGLVESEVEQRRVEEIARGAGAGRVVDHLERSTSSGDQGRC